MSDTWGMDYNGGPYHRGICPECNGFNGDCHDGPCESCLEGLPQMIDESEDVESVCNEC